MTYLKTVVGGKQGHVLSKIFFFKQILFLYHIDVFMIVRLSQH